MRYLFLLVISFNAFSMVASSQTVIPLYPKEIPNSKPSKNEETTEVRNDGIKIIGKISIPDLTMFFPPKDKANGTAIIICPGGGYKINAISHEGMDVAKKFNEMGIAAFVLKYRIPDDLTMVSKEIGPLQDAQQAISIVRKHAAEWGIQRIGIMGFSAGGHLAASAATHYAQPVLPNAQNENLRPDFQILIYPVISFQDDLTHMGSRNNLIGENPTQKKKDEYSNELKVTAQTPPAFIVHASDDGGVKPQNSIAYYLALLQNKVPAELHIYQNGGHGFGMYLPKSKDLWMERCENWMAANGWLKK